MTHLLIGETYHDSKGPYPFPVGHHATNVADVITGIVFPILGIRHNLVVVVLDPLIHN